MAKFSGGGSRNFMQLSFKYICLSSRSFMFCNAHMVLAATWPCFPCRCGVAWGQLFCYTKARVQEWRLTSMTMSRRVANHHEGEDAIDHDQCKANTTYMASNSNTTLLPIHHLRIETAELVHSLLDGGPSILQRTLITDGMGYMWLHVVLVFMVPCMNCFFNISRPFAWFHIQDSYLWPTKLYRTKHLHGLSMHFLLPSPSFFSAQ